MTSPLNSWGHFWVENANKFTEAGIQVINRFPQTPPASYQRRISLTML